LRPRLHHARGQARGYLADRSLDPATQIKSAWLGFSERFRVEGASRLAPAFRSKDMIEAGLLIAGGDIPVPLDRSATA